MNWNSYYRVIEPIHYFEVVGSSPSNTWIGSSQAIDRVFEAKNAKPGDTMHILAGGKFISREDGSAAEIAFWMPKPILEKSYGPGDDANILFEQMASLGRAEKIENPQVKIDFAGLRNRPMMAGNVTRLRRIEHSTTFEELRNLASMIDEVGFMNGLVTRMRDFAQTRWATQLFCDLSDRPVLELDMDENRHVFVKPSQEFFDVSEFIERVRNLDGISQRRVHQDCFWAEDPTILENDVFLDQVALGFDKASPKRATAPSPVK